MTESSSITQYTLLSSSSSGGNNGHQHVLSQEAKNEIEEANEIALATLVSSDDLCYTTADELLLVKTVDPQYANDLKEGQQLTWTDDYFEDDHGKDEGIIAVFDFAHEAMEQYYTDVGWAAFAVSIFVKPMFLASLAGLYPCFLRKNVRWQAQAQHVAITEDGIRFVREKHPSCWGLACTDQGRVSKTVPYEMITDCEVHEPAGNTCLCIPNVLTVVNVETAGSGGGGKKHTIAGLKDPHGFQKMLLAMKKRGAAQQRFAASTTTTPLSTPHDDTSTLQLLRDIREELRTNNALLQREAVERRGEPEVANVMTRL